MKLVGRLLDIVRGHNDAGEPVLTPEKRAAYIERWKLTGRLPENFEYAAPRTCRHFGPLLTTIGCQTCGGNVSVPVYLCAIHEECTPLQNREGVRTCFGCADYLAETDPK